MLREWLGGDDVVSRIFSRCEHLTILYECNVMLSMFFAIESFHLISLTCRAVVRGELWSMMHHGGEVL